MQLGEQRLVHHLEVEAGFALHAAAQLGRHGSHEIGVRRGF